MIIDQLFTRPLFEQAPMASPEQLAYNKLRAQYDGYQAMTGGGGNTAVSRDPAHAAKLATVPAELARMAAALKAKGIDAEAQYDALGGPKAAPVDANQVYSESTDPSREKAQVMIYKYFGQIYDYGADDGLYYLDLQGELWNQLMDKYDGEIEDIVAREPTEVLMQAAQELKGIAGDMKYELDEAGVAEGSDQQLSVRQLATISDEALDKAYGYGRSSPGNTFGWQANLKSAAYAKHMIDKGVTDIDEIADAIHKGWNVTARAFVKNPNRFDDTEKLKAAGKLEAKLQQRAKLMNIDYSQLPDDEQEKDRVVARALLQAITGGGEQDMSEVADPSRRGFLKKAAGAAAAGAAMSAAGPEIVTLVKGFAEKAGGLNGIQALKAMLKVATAEELYNMYEYQADSGILEDAITESDMIALDRAGYDDWSEFEEHCEDNGVDADDEFKRLTGKPLTVILVQDILEKIDNTWSLEDYFEQYPDAMKIINPFENGSISMPTMRQLAKIDTAAKGASLPTPIVAMANAVAGLVRQIFKSNGQPLAEPQQVAQTGRAAPALPAPTRPEFDMTPDLRQKEKVPMQRKGDDEEQYYRPAPEHIQQALDAGQLGDKNFFQSIVDGTDKNPWVTPEKAQEILNKYYGPQDMAEAAQGHTIEAHGVRGMDRRTWHKTFKNTDQMIAWAEKHDAEIVGTRDLEQARHGNLSPAKAKGVAEGKHFKTAYGWAGGSKPGGGTYKHPDQIKADREAKKKAKEQEQEQQKNKQPDVGVAEDEFDSFKFGKPITFSAYHSSKSKIKRTLPTDEFYFSDDRHTWEDNYLYKIKITLKNPYVMLDQKAEFESHAKDFLPKIKAAGHDGVIYTPYSVDYGFRQGVCFYPQRQISSIKLVNQNITGKQGVAEGSEQKPAITYKDYTLQYDYQTEDDDPEGYSTATTYYFDVLKDGDRVGEAEYFDYFGNLTIRINGKTKEFGFRHPLASQISQLVSSLPDEQKKDLSDPRFESQGLTEVFADQGSGSTDRDNADYMKRRNAAKKKGYTGRETKAGTWRVFKDGNAVAAAGPFKSADEAAAWIKKHKQGITEMDKSEPSAGRDTGPREGPEKIAKPISKEKMTKDALDALSKSMAKKDDKKKDVKESDPLMLKLQRAMVREGRVKELADDLKTMPDSDFMKKYGKAKAAIRADMKRVDEARSDYTPDEMADMLSGKRSQKQIDADAERTRGPNKAPPTKESTQSRAKRLNEKLATSDTLSRPAASASSSGKAIDDPDIMGSLKSASTPKFDRFSKTDGEPKIDFRAGLVGGDPEVEAEPRLMVDPLPDMQKWGGKFATGNAGGDNRFTAPAGWRYVEKDEDPARYGSDTTISGTGTPDWRSIATSNKSAPPALDMSPKSKFKFDRTTQSQVPADGSGGNPNIDNATRDRARAYAARQNAPVDAAKKKVDWKTIYALNKATIGTNPNVIRPGMKLKMPDGSTYPVQPGDNLSKIAAKQSQVNELSTNKLAQYKTAAAKDAKEADKAGDFKRGDKRFGGIVQATKKQFDNDAKKVDESRAARRALMARIVNSR